MTISRPRAVGLAWAIATMSLVMVLVSLVLLALDWSAITDPFQGRLFSFPGAVVTALLGVLIATRRPRNPIAWLLLAMSIGSAFYLTSGFVAIRMLQAGASPTGWVEWPAWVSDWSVATILLLLVLVIHFPDGMLPSPKWRWAGRVVMTICGVLIVGTLIDTGPTTLSPALAAVPPPLDIRGFDGGFLIAGWSSGISNLGLIIALGLTVASVVVRFRRSAGDQRRQLKWFAYTAGTAIAVVLVTYLPLPFNDTYGTDIADTGIFLGIGVAVPLTIGLAVMRFGLYDIDVFISRALVYGSLAAFITAVYVGIAVGIGAAVGDGGKPNLGLSILATAIVAVGFQPFRERVQRVANRLVYGKRATPYEVLAQFSERVAESYASEDVMPRMARVLAEGTGAQRADVWLRTGGAWVEGAVWPADAAQRDAVAAGDGELPAASDGERVIAVRHQGEVLGALSITKRSGESLTPVEENLVNHLAHQAGLVLKNVGLTAELLRRIEELRASRQRLATAQDEERRRLERNLHDGAQQHLVALKVKLSLAEMLLGRDPEKAKLTLDQLKGDADEALETLRDLARGIYPPLLADKGLQVALESQARKATLPVTVDAVGVGRYSQDVEAAVYFAVLEGLQNVQKYAHASAAVVHLSERDGALRFGISDDGDGFDTATPRTGTGLVNMADRLDALGGSLAIDSHPHQGTTVSGSLPLYSAAVADDQASRSRSGENSDLEMKPEAPTSVA